MSVCAICSEKYYDQTMSDPAEPCACGECAWERETWADTSKWLRWKAAMVCFTIGDRLLNWRPKP